MTGGGKGCPMSWQCTSKAHAALRLWYWRAGGMGHGRPPTHGLHARAPSNRRPVL